VAGEPAVGEQCIGRLASIQHHQGRARRPGVQAGLLEVGGERLPVRLGGDDDGRPAGLERLGDIGRDAGGQRLVVVVEVDHMAVRRFPHEIRCRRHCLSLPPGQS